jgi:HPt (histidine-containing phosphotransfer) domain-containing protein
MVMKGKLYNLSQIKLFLGEDRKQLGNMITIFLNETPVMLKALNDNLSDKNYDEVRFYAHKLKSSIDLFQINGLQIDIRKLETLAQEQKDIPSISQYVSEITGTLENVMQEISKETLKSA